MSIESEKLSTISSSATPFSYCLQSSPTSESFLIHWPFALHGQSIGEFQLQQHSFQEYELISLRIDWFYLLPVQGTLKILLQHHNLKASTLWCSAFTSGPNLTCIHDYWKNHSFELMDICLQTDVSTSSLTTLKPLGGSQRTGKFFKRWEHQTTLPASCETCMQVKSNS